jgi:hypothetical protein
LPCRPPHESCLREKKQTHSFQIVESSESMANGVTAAELKRTETRVLVAIKAKALGRQKGDVPPGAEIKGQRAAMG